MRRPFPAYEGPEAYVFVCYAHEDAGLVYPEISHLDKAGVNIWYDEGIAPGSEWSETLARHIKNCSVFLYFVTPGSVLSEHCRREVNFALEQSCGMLTVHLQPTNLPDGLKLTLSNRQAILRYDHSLTIFRSKVLQALRQSETENFDAQGSTSLDIGDWQLDIGTQRLSRGDEIHPLDPKEIAVLLHLAEKSPDLISTEELLVRSWPDVVVGDNVLHQVIGHLRKALGDDARQPSYIETLPRRGYRLLVPATIDDGIRDREIGTVHPATPMGGLSINWKPWRAAAAGLVLLLGVWWALTTGDSQPDATPNLSVGLFTSPEDEELSAFAALATEETLGWLSEFRQLVVSEDSAQSDYLLAGSLRLRDEQIHSSFRLSTRDGTLVWTNAFAQPASTPTFSRAQLLALQAQAAVNTHATFSDIPEELDERARRALMDGFMEWQIPGAGNLQVAIDHLELARQLEPMLWPAVSQLVVIYANRVENPYAFPETRIKAHSAVRSLLELRNYEEQMDYTLPWAFPVAIVSHRIDLDYEFAEENHLLAKTQGNDAAAVNSELGSVYASQGRLEEALTMFRAAIGGGAGINQRFAHLLLGYSLVALDQPGAALKVLDEALALAVEGTGPHMQIQLVRSMAQGLMGNTDQAGEILDATWSIYGNQHALWFPGPFAMIGRTAEARRLLDLNEKQYARGQLHNFWFVFLGYYFLGDLDRAFVWLDRVIDNREIYHFGHLHRAAYLEKLRQDPRFAQSMQKLASIEAEPSPLRTLVAAHDS